jgi:hypothetical protein
MGFNSAFKGLMKIRSVGAMLFRAERWRDGRAYGQVITRVIVTLRNFANAPKMNLKSERIICFLKLTKITKNWGEGQLLKGGLMGLEAEYQGFE